ncbi:ankyrin-3-like [Amphibalanus amphitrite]|uniref:ankyrin-3-like n=1 Tax=Amphibalanus amphitrite TaxID=1232801 RepID=UPI001C9148BF|nr:ankyrin-3-like [Amphibalanus amphitrite]XP_043230830.1 ankyrin-3-like [Amphibalanus amphitrite]
MAMTEVLSGGRGGGGGGGGALDRMLLAPVHLLHAITSNDQLRAAQALESGLDCDHRFNYGAAIRPAVNICAEKGHTDIMKLLIARGCSVNQLDSTGHSPLHSAALLGHTAAVRLLLKHRAAPNTRNAHRQTPLHAAADGNRLDITRLLLDAGADPNVSDASGRTPLMNACARANHDLALLLVRRGASAAPCANSHDSALHLLCSSPPRAGFAYLDSLLLTELVRAGGRLESRTARLCTPLHLAVMAGNVAAVEALLELGADPSAVTDIGQSAVLLAAQGGRAELVRTLLRRGADPTVSDVLGRSPLSAAFGTRGREQLLELLLDFGLRPAPVLLQRPPARSPSDLWRRLAEAARQPPPLSALCRRSVLAERRGPHPPSVSLLPPSLQRYIELRDRPGTEESSAATTAVRTVAAHRR